MAKVMKYAEYVRDYNLKIEKPLKDMIILFPISNKRRKKGTVDDIINELERKKDEGFLMVEIMVDEMIKKYDSKEDKELVDYLLGYKSLCRKDIGLWSLYDDDLFYKTHLKYYTTLDLDPRDIHEYGINEINRIKKEIEALLGSKYEDILNCMKKYFIGAGRDKKEIEDHIAAHIQESKDNIHNFFHEDMIPPPDTLGVREIAKYKQIGSPSGLYKCDKKDKDVCHFHYNTYSLSNKSLFTLGSICRHEGIPGHHLERHACKQKYAQNYPDILKGYTSYKEGWALYAEGLIYKDDKKEKEKGKEKGKLKDKIQSIYHDTYLCAIFGNLLSNLMRSVRLVIDTGINSHEYKMTYDEAFKYMSSILPEPESVIKTEILRMIGEPGRLCSYKIGEYVILELRKLWMGKKDACLKDFHRHILFMPLPLELLIEYMTGVMNGME